MPRRVTTSAKVISAGRVHFDWVAPMITLTTVSFIFIPLPTFLLVELCLLLLRTVRSYTPCRARSNAYAGASIDATRTSFLLANSWMPMLESSRP